MDSEPEDVGGEVIELRPGVDLTDEQRMLHSRRRAPGEAFCQHGRYDLDHEAQRAYCRMCKREVPLFEVLDELARDIERWIAYRDEAKRRTKVAQANADELEKVEKNAKARLRRLRKLGATVEHAELAAAVSRAREVHPGRRLAVFAADEGTSLEVRRHLRAADVQMDPLMSAGSWRVGATD